MLQLRNKGNNDPILLERNMNLDNFFDLIFPGEVTLIGHPNNPIIVHKNKILSCYAKDEFLFLMSKPRGGETMYKMKIVEQPDIDLFLKWFNKAEHKPAYRIKIVCAPLYICGMSKFNSTPVFGDLPHYYNTEEFAQTLMEKFALSDYCEII